jgi:ABC-type Mn2+/Zn2+ transport system ATPase subunit
LTASGVNKLAQMVYLISNGSLTENTVLFWDEPETNLNPKYIKIVAQFLQTLAKNGVQIFVATHDYLLAHLLSLDVEYRDQTNAPSMKFFAFYKGKDGSEVETADTLAGIENNSILDEYAAYYDLEQYYFKQTLHTT